MLTSLLPNDCDEHAAVNTVVTDAGRLILVDEAVLKDSVHNTSALM